MVTFKLPQRGTAFLILKGPHRCKQISYNQKKDIALKRITAEIDNALIIIFKTSKYGSG
jgi:hypothetical protein